MRIMRLTIEGFGNLRGAYIFSSDRVNLVLEPNESGKSTLAAAILTSLYGFPHQRASRERPIKPKERYRPWDGGAFAIEMEVEAKGRAYVIRRDFDRDEAAVYDALSGADITADFSASRDRLDLGEALTGLSREDFARSCFVGQREVDNLREADGLTHALQRIASSQAGDVAAGEALQSLSRAVNEEYTGMRLGKGKAETEIKRLDTEIDDLRAEIEAIASRRRESEEKIRRLEETSLKEGRAEAALARADYLQLLAARREAEEARLEAMRDVEEIAKYRGELAGVAAFAGFPADRLGELRELKGRIESLSQRRSELEERLVQDVEAPLGRIEEERSRLAPLEQLDAQDAVVVSDRLAVLKDLWAQRREKRRALRDEERRLREAGIDPGRVAETSGSFADLTEEERRFLASYRESSLELRNDLVQAERERDRLLQQEQGTSPLLTAPTSVRSLERLALGAGVVGVVLTMILPFILESKLWLVATVLLAAGGFFALFRLVEKRPSPGAEEFGSDLQKLETMMWQKEKQLAELQERLTGLAVRSRHADPDRLVEEFREMEALQEMAATAGALASSLREINGRYAAAAGSLLEMMKRAGRAPERGLVVPRLARCFRDDLTRSMDRRQRAGELRAELEAGVQQAASIGVQMEALRTRVEEIFREGAAACGEQAFSDDLAVSLARFEDAAAKRERHDRIVNEILPALERPQEEPAETRAARRKKEFEVLSEEIERALERDDSLAGLAPERSSREYADDRRRLQEEARQTQRERLALSEELGDVLKEYRRDYPGRLTMLAALQEARDRAETFREAVSIASEVLTAISREAYAEWAEILNEKTSEFLKRLNPNYADVRFDTDLSFSVKDARGGWRLDRSGIDAHLSAGARDQIYLAARMAVSEYLSAAGVRLPFLLDDPFATFDDERFARAMEFLVETTSRRHQVIVLSCHESRHRSWQDSAPEDLAERLRILDLTPLSA